MDIEETLVKTYKSKLAEKCIEIFNKNDNDDSCKVTFIANGERFICFDFESELHNMNEIFKDKFYRKNCDGILIWCQGKKIIAVELKETLNLGKFKKALFQLIASFLKTITLISLISRDFHRYEPLFILAFKRKEENKTYWRKKEAINTSKPVKRIYEELLNALEAKREAPNIQIPQIPLERCETINSQLIKKNVKLILLKCEESYNMEDLILIK